MDIIHEEQGPVDVFRISGRLDYTASALDLEKRLRAPWERDPQRRFPVLDLSGVTMLSSQALRAILSLAKQIQGQSGIVHVAAPSPAAKEALRVGGFLDLEIFALRDTLSDALAAATAAAKKAPPLTTEDPWKMPPPKPEEPPPPPPAKPAEIAWNITKKIAIIAKKTAIALGKAWAFCAEQIQKQLDKKK